MELDVETIPAIPLLEAEPIKRAKPILTNCTSAKDEATINSVDIAPDPPQRGKNLSVVMNITFKEVVSGGDIKLLAKYDGVIVLNESFVLCDIARESGVPCNITVGNHILKLSKPLPSLIPPGKYEGSIIVNDPNGKELVCVKFNLKL